MARPRLIPCFVVVLVVIAGSLFAADKSSGKFAFGKVHFEPVDALAYQEPDKDGKPLTFVALTNFKIDRADVMDAINTAGALIGQAAKTETGAIVMLRVTSPDKCGLAGFLSQTQQQIDLGDSFPAKSTLTAGRVAGECSTNKPGKMFDDVYEFHLTYDAPLTVIPKPNALSAGGGEPGTVYSALVKAIQAADWNVAHLHLPEREIPQTKPKAADMKEYFHGLALNYPKTVTVTGGLMKGPRANLDIRGTDNDGKKIKGVVAMKKDAAEWRVVDQTLFFEE